MKNNLTLKVRHLFMIMSLACLSALIFVSTVYAAGTLQSTEEENYKYIANPWGWGGSWVDAGNHNSTGGFSSAHHDTSQWQELGDAPGGLGNYGVSWSINGGTFGNDDLYVGDTVTFRFNMHSGDAGTHYANFLKAWIDWDTDDSSNSFDTTNDVVFDGHTDGVAGTYKELRLAKGGDLQAGYADDVTAEYTLTLGAAQEGTAYLRARVTCSESIINADYNWSHNGLNNWDEQWGVHSGADYLAAFNAYKNYGQGEIEDWKITVGLHPGAGNPVPEPATFVLFGIGLIGLARIGRKKEKA